MPRNLGLEVAIPLGLADVARCRAGLGLFAANVAGFRTVSPFSSARIHPSCGAVAVYSTTTTRLPSTSSFGWMPRPGDFEAAMRPFTRCGAPTAVLTVT